MHVCTDKISVYILIRKSFGGMESEPMLTSREKSPLPEKFSPEEDRNHNAASSRTARPTHYQRTIPAPDGPESIKERTDCLQLHTPGQSVVVLGVEWVKIPGTHRRRHKKQR